MHYGRKNMVIIKPEKSVVEMKAEEIRDAETERMNAQADFTAILTDTLLEEEEEDEIDEQNL